MNIPERTEDLQKHEFDWIPESIRKEMGHFNVFRLEPYFGDWERSVPNKRPEYYTITLAIGKSKIHYADQVIEIKKQALILSNPRILYKWEHTGNLPGGYYCIFDPDFFEQYRSMYQYEVLQPNKMHVIDLSDEQVIKLSGFYERLFEEIDSNYIYKYDVLRNLVFEMLHFAMKMRQPMKTD